MKTTRLQQITWTGFWAALLILNARTAAVSTEPWMATLGLLSALLSVGFLTYLWEGSTVMRPVEKTWYVIKDGIVWCMTPLLRARRH